MHLILCVDDRNGLSFCGRRLSRDRMLIEHMLKLSTGKRIWVHPYSLPLFPADTVTAHEVFLNQAQAGEYCFAEISQLPETAESVILYRWNRAYPATETLPQNFLSSMRLVHMEEFPGSSHEKITMEKYIP